MFENTTTITGQSGHEIQAPQWDAATIYQLVFGLVAIFVAVPGAAVGYIMLRGHRARQPSGVCARKATWPATSTDNIVQNLKVVATSSCRDDPVSKCEEIKQNCIMYVDVAASCLLEL